MRGEISRGERTGSMGNASRVGLGFVWLGRHRASAEEVEVESWAGIGQGTVAPAACGRVSPHNHGIYERRPCNPPVSPSSLSPPPAE